MSNDRAKRELVWIPEAATVREGFSLACERRHCREEGRRGAARCDVEIEMLIGLAAERLRTSRVVGAEVHDPQVPKPVELSRCKPRWEEGYDISADVRFVRTLEADL
jgi:hypothetical protein